MKFKESIIRFIKFAGGSLIGGTVDMSLVWLLTRYLFDGYWGDVIISPMISFEASVIVNFTFFWFFIWNDRIGNGGKHTFFKRLLAYNVSNVGIFAFRMLLVVVMEKIVGGNLVVINLFGRILSGLLNFIICDKLIFRNKQGN